MKKFWAIILTVTLAFWAVPAAALEPAGEKPTANLALTVNSGEPFTVENTDYGILNSSITGKKITLGEGVEVVNYDFKDGHGRQKNVGAGYLVLKSSEDNQTVYSIVNAKGEVAKRFEGANIEAPTFLMVNKGGRRADVPDESLPYWDTFYEVRNPQLSQDGNEIYDLYNATTGEYIDYELRGGRFETIGNPEWNDISSSPVASAGVKYYDSKTGLWGLVAPDGSKLTDPTFAEIECRAVTASGVVLYNCTTADWDTMLVSSNGAIKPSSGYWFVTCDRATDLVLVHISGSGDQEGGYKVLSALTGEPVSGPKLYSDYLYASEGVFALSYYDRNTHCHETDIVTASGTFSANAKLGVNSVEIVGHQDQVSGNVCVYGEALDDEGYALDDGNFGYAVLSGKGRVLAEVFGEDARDWTSSENNIYFMQDGYVTIDDGYGSEIYAFYTEMKCLVDSPDKGDIEAITINRDLLSHNHFSGEYVGDVIMDAGDGLIIVRDADNVNYLVDTVNCRILLSGFATAAGADARVDDMCTRDYYSEDKNTLVVFQTCADDENGKWGLLNTATGAFTGYLYGFSVDYNRNPVASYADEGGALWFIGDDSGSAFADGMVLAENGTVVRSGLSGNECTRFSRIGHDRNMFLYEGDDYENAGWFSVISAAGDAAANPTVSERFRTIGYLDGNGRMVRDWEIDSMVYDPIYRVQDQDTNGLGLVARDGRVVRETDLGSLGEYNHFMIYAEEDDGSASDSGSDSDWYYDDDDDANEASVRTAGMLNCEGAWLLQGDYRLPAAWAYCNTTLDEFPRAGRDQTLALQDAENERVFYLYDFTQYVAEGHKSDTATAADPAPLYVKGWRSALVKSKLRDTDSPFGYFGDFEVDLNHNFYWDDRWLMADSSTYNSKLAIAAMCMAWSAYNNEWPDYKYLKRYFKQLKLEDLDMSAYKSRVNNSDDDYAKTIDLVGYGFGHRTSVDANGNPVELLFIAVRGTPGNDEWISNANVDDLVKGKGGDPRFHEAFRNAELELLGRLDAYCFRNGIDSDTAHVFISGHSRGAAVANLLAADLQGHFPNAYDYTYVQGFDKSRVYAYTFATPACTTDGDAWAVDSNRYNNIFNIVNPEDFVPRVPLKDWGFKRYGMTYYLPSKSTEYTKYSRYIGKVQQAYQDNYGVKYLPYDSGAGAVDGLVKSARMEAPDVAGFYREDPAWRSAWGLLNPADYKVEPMSFREFFGHLTAYLGRKKLSEMGQAINGVKSGLLGFQTEKAQILWFFVSHFVTHRIEHGHTMETYLTWVETLDEAGVGLHGMFEKDEMGKVSCYCPVNLYVHAPNGTIVSQVVDGEATDLTNDKSAPAVFYDQFTDEKSAWIPLTGGYYVTVEPYEDGVMDITWTQSGVEGASSEIVNYESLTLTKGSSYRVDSQETQESAPLSDSIKVTNPKGAEVSRTSVTPVTDALEVCTITVTAGEGGTITGPARAAKGEHAMVSAHPDASHEFAGWYENGKLVEGATQDYTFAVRADRTLEARFSTASTPVDPDPVDPEPVDPKPSTPIDIAKVPMSLKGTTFTYNHAGPIQPEVIVPGLTRGVDYQVSYVYNRYVGTGVTRVVGLGKYKGEQILRFSIVPAAITSAVPRMAKTSVAYTGGALKPTVKFKYNIFANDCTLTYKNNKKIGKATVTITGKNNYTGSTKLTFNIVPAKASISKTAAAKKAMTITAKTQKGGVKYQFSYRLGKSGKWVNKTSTKAKLKISKLKSKKSYQVRVRAFKKVGKTTYYGAWSPTKTVKVK